MSKQLLKEYIKELIQEELMHGKNCVCSIIYQVFDLDTYLHV
jgi:hypothetical protein